MNNSIFTQKSLRVKLVSAILPVMLSLITFSAGAQCTPAGDQTTYGQEQWIGYVYNNYSTAVSPPTSPFSGTYRGYVTKTSDFTYDMGNGAVSGDNVCGVTSADYFAIRFKMKKALAAGYYKFHVGGDDGFRLSLNGGTSFPDNLQAWSDHGNISKEAVYYHAGGVINLVIEYYEKAGGATVDFNVKALDCNSTAPTTITGDNSVYACYPTTTLTASGGTAGTGSHYEWGTGTVAGQNIISGQQGASITRTLTATTTYWVRRVSGYECASNSDAIFYTVQYQNLTPGNPAEYGNNIWKVYTTTYNVNANNAETYKGYFTDSNLSYNSEASFAGGSNPSTAATWEGCNFTSNDYYFFTAKRQGFPCNDYVVTLNKWDDEIWVYINDETTPVYHYNGWSGGAPTVPYPLGTIHLGPESKITVKVRESAGDANAYIKIVPAVTAPASITGTNVTCPGTAVALTAQGGTTGVAGVYQWGTGTVPGQNIIAGATTAQVTVRPVANTTYWARISKPSTCVGGYTDAAFFTISLQENTWIGPANSDWNNATNWSCGAIPTIGQVVIIPTASHQPAITSTAYAKTLTVQSAASVTIAAGGTMYIADELVVSPSATFTVENNGALVQQHNAVNSGKIKLIKNTNPLYRLDYTLWSAPVTGQNMAAFSPNTTANRFYEYKYAQNASNAWIEGYWSVDATVTDFTKGKGYLIRMPNSSTVAGYEQGTGSVPFIGNFTGEPNNGAVNVTLSMDNNRFTAVGNPYPSPISVTDFFTANGSKLATDTGIYLWRKRNNAVASSYATLTLAGFVSNPAAGGGADQQTYYRSGSEWLLAQGQGFIVKTSTTATTAPVLTFENSMRRAAPGVNQGFFREAQSTASKLWLNVTNSAGAAAQTAVAYMENTTTGIDYGYDGKLLADANTVALYSIAQDTNFAIQARDTFNVSDVVAMGFVAPAAGEYTINLDHAEGVFENGQAIYLKDNVEGIIRNISGRNYTFTTEAGTFESRFEVMYTNSVLGTDNPEAVASNVVVYKNNNQVNINAPQAIASVAIFDVLGRNVYNKAGINNVEFSTGELNVAHEALIVKITLANGAQASKKIIF
ncbi:T9SS sorting signal type C domain-containing protein [Flavobacterium psychrotrophum]|uniref:T9SS sorting signal type C domain-containing protein n=1 Tax=Flavobacterium psychrotrophum TaxID=2294119 RepID=UPI000E320919|nr:T9SS sorting signal type C domain-containing protein [Flavobacterium psychrotrophum]